MNKSTLIVLSAILILVVVILIIRARRKHRRDIVKAWVSHILYTRLAMQSLFDSDEERFGVYIQRLMKNQDDIGDIFRKEYDDKIANFISSELKKHISIAGDVLKDVKTESSSLYSDVSLLYRNGEDIGNFLDKLFDTGITYSTHMKNHISALIEDAKTYHSKDHSRDIEKLDEYVNHTVDMAFDLSRRM